MATNLEEISSMTEAVSCLCDLSKGSGAVWPWSTGILTLVLERMGRWGEEKGGAELIYPSCSGRSLESKERVVSLPPHHPERFLRA